MQNFYLPSVAPPHAMGASHAAYQGFVPQGPHHIARNRSQQAVRLALHERLTKRPKTFGQVTTAMWQRMALPPGQMASPAQPFDQEDLRCGEWAGDGLLAIQKLAQECIQSTNRLIFFKHTAKGWEPTKMGHELIQVVQALSVFAKGDRRDLSFATRIEMMLDAFVNVGLSELSFDDPQAWLFQRGYQLASMANLFNGMGEEIRTRGGSASVGRAMQRHDDLHAAKWRETKAYFGKIARGSPTCHAKRFELELPSSSSFDKDAMFRHMHEASGIFVRSAKQMYGEAIVGDARLIDRGDSGGHQAHVVLVFDGPNAQELAQIDQALADIWREQTRDGYLVDVNAMSVFQFRATGHLHRGYETSAGQLEKAAIYLARTSEILEVRAAAGPAGLVIGETSHETKARGSRGRSRR